MTLPRLLLLLVVLPSLGLTSPRAQLPSFIPFGVGCAGSAGTPLLRVAPGMLPLVDSTVPIELRNLPAGNGQAFVVLGFSNTDWSGISLPADLTSFGIPGCNVYVSVEASFLVATAGGRAEWLLPIPDDAALSGLRFFTQGLVLDPGVNALGGVVSNAAEGIVGNLTNLPSTFETWESAPLQTKQPGNLISADAGNWFIDDTVTAFPVDCGPTPHRAKIIAGATGRALQLTSEDSQSSCADNIWIFTMKSVPLVPGTTLSFNETGTLTMPRVYFPRQVGDRISLVLSDNQGHVIFYTPQRAPSLQPFDGPVSIYDVDKEYFIDPIATGSDFYLRDVYTDFAQLPGFNPSNAKITTVLFQVDEHGTATIDNIAFTVR